MSDSIAINQSELIPISELRPHPRNYQEHPEDQILHLMQSLRDNGLWRSVLVARDNTILAGHGIYQAMLRLQQETISIIRYDLDPNEARALKILAIDNEVSHLAVRDDRSLTDLLKEIKEFDVTGLLGTGYDEQMLAALVFVTRPEDEMPDFDAAAHWAGMPDFERYEETTKIVVNFATLNARREFAEKLDITITEKTKTIWWPQQSDNDVSSVIWMAKE